MISLLVLAQAAAGPPAPVQKRWEDCVELAIGDPVRGIAEAQRWNLAGGGFLARQCLGMAYAAQRRWTSAAGAFEAAAREAEVAKDTRASKYWSQAGNAWIAAAEPVKARAALDAALAAATLAGLELGEAHLDRARALVATGDLAGARRDLDKAVVEAPADPMVWLLSATLARKMGDLALAQRHIAEAVKRAADDASVQLEAGNIALLSGDQAAARVAWQRAAQIAPGTPQGASALAALRQFDGAQ
ncbi:tetratricopeptide repeat protein [Sphingomonas sp.]|uniref:tetratricopeptide repeat protein n=1 Tax=Sphingomonas sp. TaxID=28214 RepID=UPI001ED66603|nr:tetratricopeptide repeat protein [Sphingomonas sp.]MBX3594860.1 tetratricopeptide repeat protein [Sphingomonas sp.]